MSKYNQYKEDQLYHHKHCPTCNKMIPEDDDYCSKGCMGHSERKDKGNKKKIGGFVLVYVVVIVTFIIIAFV
jgi:predicted nucleic acid-binding Zn ribbon protein